MIITKGVNVKDDKGNIYKLGNHIGNGGFGQVFLSNRLSDGKLFAVKTIFDLFASEKDYESFRNEIATAQKITSPHVIKYEFANDGTQFSELPPYIIMEYASKGTLADIINNKKSSSEYFSNEELKALFLQLASGMKDINKHLIHRDIKTENILVTDEGLKISDFGLAKFAQDCTRTMTFKGYGTPKYVAPEAWKNDNNTILMDIYSMGIVFYQLATLDYPYEIKNKSNEDYREAHIYQPVIAPNKFNKNLSPTITSIMLRMLEKPISKRFNSWDSIIDFINKLSFEPLPIDKFVDKALEIQINRDISIQKINSQEEKNKKANHDFCKLVKSQYETEIYLPIKELIDDFNSKYTGKSMKIDNFNREDTNTKFVNNIILPNMTKINISMEVIYKENFKRERQNEIPYLKAQKYYENYIPMCNQRKVYAWGKIEASNGTGYNLLLLENRCDDYGEWWEMHNTNSGFVPKSRNEPFGFSLNELPKEINYINVMHIYNSNLNVFKVNNLYDFILKNMS